MTILRTLGTNSAIYTATNLAHRGAAFLLMPLYTAYLDPAAYGVLGVVTAVNGFLAIAFTLGLTGAVTRFYFEYRNDPRLLAEFWGSVLCFVMLVSVVLGALFLVAGPKLLRPLLGDIDFWPYVAIGIVTTVVQPFFVTFLAILQAQNEALRFAAFTLAHFGLTTAFTVLFVVFLHWGVEGALFAILLSTTAFFGLALWYLRFDIVLGLRWRHLRPAFAYGIPQIPHSVASQTTAMSDRLILNSRLGTESAGLYSVGSMIAMVVEIAASSVNRAYVPLSMAALKGRDRSELEQMRAIGLMVVAAFCMLGAIVGLFAAEIIALLTAPEFQAASTVVPVLVFGGVASAIYYLLVNVLFFDRVAIRFLPICTLTAATLNVTLALLLIPNWGLLGAAAATLLAQTSATLLVALVGARFDPVKWDYGRYAAAFAGSLAATISLGGLDSGAIAIAAKLGGLVVLAGYLGSALWGRPLILIDASARLLRGRFAEAVELLRERGMEVR